MAEQQPLKHPRVEELFVGREELGVDNAVFKSVNDLSDFSAKKTLLFLLRQIKDELEADKFTPEGIKFLLMAISANYGQM